MADFASIPWARPAGVDFQSLADLGKSYHAARQQGVRDSLASQVDVNNPMSLADLAKRHAQAGDMQGAAQAATLYKSLSASDTTDDIKEWKLAQGQGYKGTLQDWIVGNKRAGATNVNTNVNTAEGFGAAQTKARIQADVESLKEASKQALAATRLRPLLDEVDRLADKTPEGIAGPVSALGARIAGGLGIEVPEGWSNAELLSSISQRLVPIVREPGPTSEKELDLYLKAVPGLMQSVGGRRKVVRMTRAIGERANEIAKIYRAHIGSPNLHDELGRLDRPIFDPKDLANEAPSKGGGTQPSRQDLEGEMRRRGLLR